VLKLSVIRAKDVEPELSKNAPVVSLGTCLQYNYLDICGFNAANSRESNGFRAGSCNKRVYFRL
jgi:hypothetical protein